MTSYKREILSAIVDDEGGIGTQVAIDELLKDSEAKKTWENYFLISDCLRGRLPQYIDSSISQRIINTIVAEENISTLAAKKSGRFLKPFAAFAVAASIMIVVVFNVQQLDRQSSPVQPTATPAITKISPESDSGTLGQPTLLQEVAEVRFNRYIVHHNEYISSTGMQGMPAFTRIVAYETDNDSE